MPRRSLTWRVTYRIGVHTILPNSFCDGTKPYRVGLLFTHIKNGDFSEERSYAAPISKVKSHAHIGYTGVHTIAFAPAPNHTGLGYCSHIRTVISAQYI